MVTLDPTTAPLVAPMPPVRHRVVDARVELPGTVTLAVEPLDEPLAPFRGGQFNMLWAFGAGEVPISLSGDPTRPGPLVHTIRGVSSATVSLCALRTGDVLGVRGPFGNDWGVARARRRDVLLVAGGIGFAPLRPVLYEILADRRSFGRVALLVGAKAPVEVLYTDELARWRRDPYLDLEVLVTVDHPDTTWTGDVGLVTGLLDRAPVDPSRTTAFVCGPEPMMRAVAGDLVTAGVEPAHVRVSLERNMKCGIAHCGHCQLGPTILCRDGPVYGWDAAGPLLATEGL
jgi:anaerobic sulfite reductase subunit B